MKLDDDLITSIIKSTIIKPEEWCGQFLYIGLPKGICWSCQSFSEKKQCDSEQWQLLPIGITKVAWQKCQGFWEMKWNKYEKTDDRTSRDLKFIGAGGEYNIGLLDQD